MSGEMIAFGYEATGLASDDLFVYTIDPRGAVKREVRLKVPYVSVMHDMAITQKHIVFPFGGYVTSRERLQAGKVHWGWDSTKPSHIGVLPRDGDAKDVRWFRGPERCMMHVFNAHTEGNKVILYAPFYESNFFPFFPPVDGSPWNPAKARVRAEDHARPEIPFRCLEGRSALGHAGGRSGTHRQPVSVIAGSLRIYGIHGSGAAFR